MAAEYELEIYNDEEHSKYEAYVGKDAVAELTYQFAGGRTVLMETFVDESYREHGIATELIAFVLNDLRARGRRMTVVCPLVGEYLVEHPEYADLVDEAHPGSGIAPQ